MVLVLLMSNSWQFNMGDILEKSAYRLTSYSDKFLLDE